MPLVISRIPPVGNLVEEDEKATPYLDTASLGTETQGNIAQFGFQLSHVHATIGLLDQLQHFLNIAIPVFQGSCCGVVGF